MILLFADCLDVNPGNPLFCPVLKKNKEKSCFFKFN